MLDRLELTRMQPTNGRNSRPQVSGLSPLTLQVVGQEQEHAEHRYPGQGDRGVRTAAGAVAGSPAAAAAGG